MPITQADAPCWVLAPDPPLTREPDEHEPGFWHWPTEETARKHVGDYKGQVVAPVQRSAPCWHVTCDGDCETTLDEEDEYGFHFETAAEAEKLAAEYEWKTTGDGRLFCEEDAPDGAIALPRLQPVPGQMTLEDGHDH